MDDGGNEPKLFSMNYKRKFSTQYERSYDSDVEYQKRLKIFMENALYIDWMNKQQNSYECKLVNSQH